MRRIARGNGAHIIILIATPTKTEKTAISSSQSQQIAIVRKHGACFTRGEATRMTSAITREMIAPISPADSESTKNETFVVDGNVTGCDRCSYNGKVKSKCTGFDDESNNTPPGIRFSFAVCHPTLSQEADGFQLLVVSGSSKHFNDPELIRGVESRMREYTRV